MSRIFREIELAIDKAVPYLLIVLLVTIIVDIALAASVENYYVNLEIIDYAIVFIFVVDLLLKFIRAKSLKGFLRKYWLEIIAVLPAFVLVRIVEEASGLFLASQEITRAQGIFHEVVGIEEEAPKIASTLGRSSRFARFIAPIARLPRFAKALKFYALPKRKKV